MPATASFACEAEATSLFQAVFNFTVLGDSEVVMVGDFGFVKPKVRHRVSRTFSAGRKFSWDIEDNIPYYYQASGKTPSQAAVMVVVTATTVDMACKKIKQKISNFTLIKLERLGRASGPPGNQTAVDVTPTMRQCVSCCGLLSKKKPVKKASLVRKTLFFRQDRVFEDLLPRVKSGGGRYHQPHGYVYYGSGEVEFYGSADVTADDAGDLSINLPFSGQLENNAVGELYIPPDLPPLPRNIQDVQQTVNLDCCASPLPLVMSLQHNLQVVSQLAGFLKTNQQSLPGLVKLIFSERQRLWQGGFHLSGQSPAGNFQEVWDFTFQFICEAKTWKFAMTASRAQQSGRFSSRLLTYYKDRIVCPNGGVFFGVNFVIDCQKQSSVPRSSYPVVVNDEAGFFSGLTFAFRIVSHGVRSNQYPFDNTAPYEQALIGGF